MATFVKLNLDGINRLKKDLPKWSAKMEKEVADKAPSEIIKNIRKQRTGIFPGASLPPNAPSTTKRKQSQGKAPLSMIDDGVLTTAGKWRTSKGKGGHLIKPPANRAKEVKILDDGINGKRYRILWIPKGFIPGWIKILVNSRFKAFIRKYT